MNDTGSSEDFDAAMRDLLNADSYDAVRQVLNHNPVLMSPDIIKPISEEANEAGKRGQHDTRVWLLVHIYLLNKCHELGIEKGFTDWKKALTDQVGIATRWIRHYLDGNDSALNEAMEEILWALMGARRQGPLSQFWDPLLDQLRFLIQEWINNRDGGKVALGMLMRLLKENVERVTKADVSWPARVMLYSNVCNQWFQRYGEAPALDRAIELGEQAIAAHSEPEWISGVGRLRLFRFELKSRAEDLQAAIHAQHLALQMVALTDLALRAAALDRLGIALRTSFEQSSVIDELNQAVDNHEAAVRISPSDTPDHPAHLGNLASALLMRYSLTHDEEDYRRAGDLLRQEVKLCGPGHGLRADALGNLGAWLTIHANMPPSVSAEAIEVLTEALQLAGNRHVKWTWELSLAQALLAASGPSPDDERRQEAEQHLQAVLEATPPAWPNRAAALAFLGQLQAEAGLDEAGNTLANAVEVGLSTRLDAARSSAQNWISWAISKHRIDHLKKASAQSLEILDALSRRQESVRDQILWRRQARTAVEDAAFALASAGEIDDAVAHLERGRATVLKQSLDFATRAQSSAETLTAVLPHIRVVYLIAARDGGMALIPGENRIAAQALPELTFDRVYDAVVKLLTAQENRMGPGGAVVWRRDLDSVTRWMYEAVVEPLRDSLTRLGPSLALLPDGLSGLLPWAAAWEPDINAPQGRKYLIDLSIDLTIAPTAGVLAGAFAQARATTSDGVLIVASRDGSTNVLKDIDAEAATVAAAHPGAVELRSGVTPAAVLKAMQEAAIVHFACHGRVNLLEPLKSYLVLSDEQRLTTADLIAAEHRPRRLVVLSACETSVAGVVAPTEVMGFPLAFLRLGFAGVLGSLWPIRDDGAALLMTRFHQVIGQRSPATALAEAQRWLRSLSREEAAELLGRPIDGEFSHVETWGAFTFTGA